MALPFDQTGDIEADPAAPADETPTKLVIRNNAVTNAKLADDAVDTAEIKNGAVTGAKIATGAVDDTRLASNSVTNAKIATGAVDDTKLASNAVTNAKLADDAVDTAEIKNGAVTGAKIATGAVDDTKLASDAVTNAKVANDAINTAEIVNSAVTNAKLADVAAHTFKARKTNSTGAPEDATATEATALLDAFTGDSGSGGLKGLVPAPSAGDAAANKVLGAGGSWVTQSGASTVSIWMPDAPPSSPHSCNDEFDGGSWDTSKWTSDFDHGNVGDITIDTVKKMAKITGAYAGVDRFHGKLQAVTALGLGGGTEYGLFTRIHQNTSVSSSASAGLFVTDGTGNTNKIQALLIRRHGTSFALSGPSVYAMSKYDTYTTQIDDGSGQQGTYLYFGISGTNFFAYVSHCGTGWTKFSGATALGFTPTHFGLGQYGSASGTWIARASFFRCYIGAGSSVPENVDLGRYVSVGV